MSDAFGASSAHADTRRVSWRQSGSGQQSGTDVSFPHSCRLRLRLTRTRKAFWYIGIQQKEHMIFNIAKFQYCLCF